MGSDCIRAIRGFWDVPLCKLFDREFPVCAPRSALPAPSARSARLLRFHEGTRCYKGAALRRDLFHYELPPGLIATHPPEDRDGGRLLVLDQESHQHRAVRDLPDLLAPNTLMVVNDTRVMAARLLGHREGSGGKVELLLLQRLDREGLVERWFALGRASKALRPGQRLTFSAPGGAPGIVAEIEGPSENPGAIVVRLSPTPPSSIDELLDVLGHVPLPPYIARADEAADRERYQTVFARNKGAVAAPTAGLHLSEPLLEALRARGVAATAVTLHVGLGTFRPVTTEDLDDHAMHEETFVVPPEAEAAIRDARARGARVLAIGTTVVRALESAADPDAPGHVKAGAGATRLLIQPGYSFRVVDQLFTNFHLPESTLLALVSAFAGRERVLAAYRAAIEASYRFYSYGDAMLIRARCAP